MICAGVIGATGYVGVELVRLLLRHPNVEKIVLSSVSFEGQSIEDIYPNFRGLLAPKCDGQLLSADEVVHAATQGRPHVVENCQFAFNFQLSIATPAVYIVA